MHSFTFLKLDKTNNPQKDSPIKKMNNKDSKTKSWTLFSIVIVISKPI